MKRTIAQNNLYKRLVRRCAIHLIATGKRTGTVNRVMGEVDMVFKMNFNYRDYHGYREPLSTANLSVREHWEFFENCQQLALEFWGVNAFSEDEKEGFGVK